MVTAATAAGAEEEAAAEEEAEEAGGTNFAFHAAYRMCAWSSSGWCLGLQPSTRRAFPASMIVVLFDISRTVWWSTSDT